MSKVAKLVTVAVLVSVALGQQDSQAKPKRSDLLDNDSEFMRGFETGLFLRTKGGDIEEYGCKVSNDSNKGVRGAFDMIKSNLDLAKSSLRLDPIVDEALTVIMEFMDGLVQFISIVMSQGKQETDYYCTGMIFGLQGSKILVKVANTLINPIGDDGQPTKTFEKKKDIGIDEKKVGDYVEKLGRGILKTAEDTYKAHLDGEL